MYLHLGQDTVIRSDEIVGIFDLETSTISKITRTYLANCQKKDVVRTVSSDLPKSFVLCCKPGEQERVYLSQISSTTLLKRTRFMETLRNVNDDESK